MRLSGHYVGYPITGGKKLPLAAGNQGALPSVEEGAQYLLKNTAVLTEAVYLQ